MRAHGILARLALAVVMACCGEKWRAATPYALQSANLRRPAILRYATWRLLPDFAGWFGYPSIAAPVGRSRIDAMCQTRHHG